MNVNCPPCTVQSNSSFSSIQTPNLAYLPLSNTNAAHPGQDGLPRVQNPSRSQPDPPVGASEVLV